MEPIWMNLMTGFLGAVIGGACSVGAIIVQGKLNKRVQEENEQRIIRGFLQGIHDEVDTIWSRYMQTAGGAMATLPHGDPFQFYFVVAHDYFTVYHANAFLLGRVPDPDLRRLIVRAYTTAKGLVDSFRMNNEMFQRYDNASLLFQQTNQPVYQHAAQAILTRMAQYAGSLRQGHQELRTLVEALLPALLKYLNQ